MSDSTNSAALAAQRLRERFGGEYCERLAAELSPEYTLALQEYVGPKGGHGYRDTSTGRIIYGGRPSGGGGGAAPARKPVARPNSLLPDAPDEEADARAFAQFYADCVNALLVAGADAEEVIADAVEELEGTGWTLAQDRRGFYRPADESHDSEEGAGAEEFTLSLYGWELATDHGIGEVWQGQSGRWFTKRKDGRTVPARNPNAKDEPKSARGRVAARAEKGGVDRQKLGERLGKHVGTGEDDSPSDYQKGRGRAAARMFTRHHGENAAHRVEDLADTLEAALAKVQGDDWKADRARSAIKGQLQKLHLAHEALSEKKPEARVEVNEGGYQGNKGGVPTSEGGDPYAIERVEQEPRWDRPAVVYKAGGKDFHTRKEAAAHVAKMKQEDAAKRGAEVEKQAANAKAAEGEKKTQTLAKAADDFKNLAADRLKKAGLGEAARSLRKEGAFKASLPNDPKVLQILDDTFQEFPALAEAGIKLRPPDEPKASGEEGAADARGGDPESAGLTPELRGEVNGGSSPANGGSSADAVEVPSADPPPDTTPSGEPPAPDAQPAPQPEAKRADPPAKPKKAPRPKPTPAPKAAGPGKGDAAAKVAGVVAKLPNGFDEGWTDFKDIRPEGVSKEEFDKAILDAASRREIFISRLNSSGTESPERLAESVYDPEDGSYYHGAVRNPEYRPKGAGASAERSSPETPAPDTIDPPSHDRGETMQPLPALTGSEKQVAWAAQIRDQMLADAPEFARKALADKTDSRFWIDNRTGGLSSALGRAGTPDPIVASAAEFRAKKQEEKERAKELAKQIAEEEGLGTDWVESSSEFLARPVVSSPDQLASIGAHMHTPEARRMMFVQKVKAMQARGH